MKKIIFKIYDIVRLLKFCWRLMRLEVFSTHNPVGLLLLIQAFIFSESKTYNKEAKVLFRSYEQNAELLVKLIEVYLQTKSNETLKQVLELIRMMIVKGE